MVGEMDTGVVQQDGFSILPGVLERTEIQALFDAVSIIDRHEGVRSRGNVYAIRNLLNVAPEINESASSVKVCSIVRKHLGKNAFPVRGTLFDKTDGANWLVPWHQDLTICVMARIHVPGYGPWTVKAGMAMYSLQFRYWRICYPRVFTLTTAMNPTAHCASFLEHTNWVV
jgi:hypothetical protein